MSRLVGIRMMCREKAVTILWITSTSSSFMSRCTVEVNFREDGPLASQQAACAAVFTEYGRAGQECPKAGITAVPAGAKYRRCRS